MYSHLDVVWVITVCLSRIYVWVMARIPSQNSNIRMALMDSMRHCVTYEYTWNLVDLYRCIQTILANHDLCIFSETLDFKLHNQT